MTTLTYLWCKRCNERHSFPPNPQQPPIEVCPFCEAYVFKMETSDAPPRWFTEGEEQ